jgi:hypothetical protein
MAPSLDTVSQSGFNDGQDYYSSGLRAKYNAEVARLTTKSPVASQSTAKLAHNRDLSSYFAQGSVKACSSKVEKTVPEGWPQILTGPMAWTAADFENESWVLNLSYEDKEEIDRALVHFKSRSRSKFSLSQGLCPTIEINTSRSRAIV